MATISREDAAAFLRERGEWPLPNARQFPEFLLEIPLDGYTQ